MVSYGMSLMLQLNITRGFLFGLTLLGFAGVHFYYIINNRTSIEYVANRATFIRADFDKSGGNYEVVEIDPKTNLYDQGFYSNWCSVMGSNPFLCLCNVYHNIVIHRIMVLILPAAI